MTFNLAHIKVIGRYGQGQHPISTSRSQGQSQGHKGHFRFLTIFANLMVLTALMIFNLDHIRVIGRYGQGQHPILTSRSQGQSQGHKGHFRFLTIFTKFAVLTALMTLNLYHIHIIGRYGRCQYPILTSRT